MPGIKTLHCQVYTEAPFSKMGATCLPWVGFGVTLENLNQKIMSLKYPFFKNSLVISDVTLAPRQLLKRDSSFHCGTSALIRIPGLSKIDVLTMVDHKSDVICSVTVTVRRWHCSSVLLCG